LNKQLKFLKLASTQHFLQNHLSRAFKWYTQMGQKEKELEYQNKFDADLG
jgi:hypothetical protein